MGVIDKFLNAMKMNDDDSLDDYLDDGYDDDLDDDFDEDAPPRRLINRRRDEDDDTPRPVKSTASSAADSSAQTETRQARPRQTRSSSKVSPMRTAKRGPGMEVCVIKPKNMEDARDVTETLLDECTVVLNMEGIDFELAQRIIDFACGSCYAVHGKLQKVSNYIFIITPASVDISGDFQDILNGAYDIPSFGTNI